MSIAIDPTIEQRIREQAKAQGLSVTAYIESLLDTEQSAGEELESLAEEALCSGEPIEAGPGFWEERHRLLDERLKHSDPR
jgi:hypothetical protein